MNPPVPHSPKGARHIVVADQDHTVVQLVVDTLRSDGHVVFPAYDAASASRIARVLNHCDLMISNTRIAGVDGVDLITHLRQERPSLPIIYLANPGRSTPEMEADLPVDVPILRVPFTADELRDNVAKLLDRHGA